MSYPLTLMTVRLSGSNTRPIEPLIYGYLQRCGPVFMATNKTFRTVDALMADAKERQQRDAAVLWLADPGGASLSSENFAQRIGQARDTGRRRTLIAVGPADGWSDEARGRADLRLSLGPMTLPHELAALVLSEQIYRASTILQGHPYHLGH